MSTISPHVKAVRSLYRRSLRLALDWAVQRSLWRGQAVYIRSLFDANRSITDPRHQRVLFNETEKLLEKWKHPDPYRPPTAPGGSYSYYKILRTASSLTLLLRFQIREKPPGARPATTIQGVCKEIMRIHAHIDVQHCTYCH
ncbi:hypothetical protein PV11_04054 [Exophiala sideris]|uniref:NADH dehydrogenase [ubiquinone] 1 beta subcomplex subunit 9 n=1 Tax=Exophiala sideris TaxID=1016849 RepID=A0A0D1VZP0_9EURO|nr:hypothetical protein PV11_04054 [Exophiala sideris]